MDHLWARASPTFFPGLLGSVLCPLAPQTCVAVDAEVVVGCRFRFFPAGAVLVVDAEVVAGLRFRPLPPGTVLAVDDEVCGCGISLPLARAAGFLTCCIPRTGAGSRGRRGLLLARPGVPLFLRPHQVDDAGDVGFGHGFAL